MPVFNVAFGRPSPTLCDVVLQIRDRLALPRDSPGEPRPGAWGLRGSTHYVLALHFRAVPKGFEPTPDTTEITRTKLFSAFLENTAAAAAEALTIAQCRGLKLLIYLATDHPKALRPAVQRALSPFGEVVFGLKEEEVRF